MAKNTQLTSEHSMITVGVVTYNSADHIEACVESIQNNLADAIPTVIILDNASKDDTVGVVKKLIKKSKLPVHLLPQHSNNGFAWGINRIVEVSGSDWLCFINPDARLLTKAYRHALEVARRFPTCGAIGGTMVDPDGNPQECGGVFPTPLMAIWDWCGLRHVIPRFGWSTQLKFNLPEDADPVRIDYPTGAFWMLRREVFQRIGPFDEQFFLYFEETDFCKRARDKGWISFIHPAIRIEHHRGASVSNDHDGDSRDPLGIYFESLIKYLIKHFPPWRVDNSLTIIHKFLKFRKWLRKDPKSERILEAFEEGLEVMNVKKINQM